MTTGELIRAARGRAGLSQARLGDLLGMPRSQIARWESEGVEPPLSTVRRVLHACGFDLSLSLLPYEPDEQHEAQLRELQRLTPQERLRALLEQLGGEPR
jgi:transcriptional regulator with XRE-family HTH domain